MSVRTSVFMCGGWVRSCNPDAVYFVSSAVVGGDLALMTVRLSSRRQWENNALALKAARASFAVAAAGVGSSVEALARLPDPVPGAGAAMVAAAP